MRPQRSPHRGCTPAPGRPLTPQPRVGMPSGAPAPAVGPRQPPHPRLPLWPLRRRTLLPSPSHKPPRWAPRGRAPARSRGRDGLGGAHPAPLPSPLPSPPGCAPHGHPAAASHKDPGRAPAPAAPRAAALPARRGAGTGGTHRARRGSGGRAALSAGGARCAAWLRPPAAREEWEPARTRHPQPLRAGAAPPNASRKRPGRQRACAYPPPSRHVPQSARRRLERTRPPRLSMVGGGKPPSTAAVRSVRAVRTRKGGPSRRGRYGRARSPWRRRARGGSRWGWQGGRCEAAPPGGSAAEACGERGAGAAGHSG